MAFRRFSYKSVIVHPGISLFRWQFYSITRTKAPSLGLIALFRRYNKSIMTTTMTTATTTD